MLRALFKGKEVYGLFAQLLAVVASAKVDEVSMYRLQASPQVYPSRVGCLTTPLMSSLRYLCFGRNARSGRSSLGDGSLRGFAPVWLSYLEVSKPSPDHDLKIKENQPVNTYNYCVLFPILDLLHCPSPLSQQDQLVHVHEVLMFI